MEFSPRSEPFVPGYFLVYLKPSPKNEAIQIHEDVQMRVLIAEDDAALASFVRKGLEAEHYAVDIAADGEQARALASELNFDIIVLDLALPHLDGVAILRFVRT